MLLIIKVDVDLEKSPTVSVNFSVFVRGEHLPRFSVESGQTKMGFLFGDLALNTVHVFQ